MGKRRRLIALVALVVGLSCLAASAAADENPATTPSSSPPSSVQVNPGFGFTGAEITKPGASVRRHLDAYRAAVFVQSWIGVATSGAVRHERPPARAGVYRVDVTGSWNGAGDLSARTIFYASDGTRAWIASPPAPDTPVADLDFWVAPDRTIEAFAGTAQLVPTLGTEAETSTTTVPPAAEGTGGNDGSAWPWIVGVGALVAAAAVTVTALARRRSARTS